MKASDGIEYRIQVNVPMDISTMQALTKYPFLKLNVGDSFFVPDGLVSEIYKLGRAASAASVLKDKPKFKNKSWVENGVHGVRVWRVR